MTRTGEVSVEEVEVVEAEERVEECPLRFVVIITITLACEVIGCEIADGSSCSSPACTALWRSLAREERPRVLIRRKAWTLVIQSILARSNRSRICRSHQYLIHLVIGLRGRSGSAVYYL